MRDLLVRGRSLQFVDNMESDDERIVLIGIDCNVFDGHDVLLDRPMADYVVFQAAIEYAKGV
jgi:hypothetical protein